MSDQSTWMEIAVLVMSGLALIAACCTPCMTALGNIIMFAGFRIIRDRLAPRTSSSNAIGTDSKLVCTFQNDII